MDKRVNAVTFKGTPLTLVGPALAPGAKAPPFTCLSGLDSVTLAQTPASPRLFSVVPSLDTPVCSMQTKKFDETLASYKGRLACYTVSLDLPFAQKRFCTTEGVANMQTLSDVHNQSFGKNWGVLLRRARAACWAAADARCVRCRQGRGDNLRPDRAGGDRGNRIMTPP